MSDDTPEAEAFSPMFECFHDDDCEECGERFRDLRRQINRYREVLKALPCEYSHNDQHETGCHCADCRHTTESCGCRRCTAIHDFDDE